MKALLINCTLKASPEKSNTEALAEVVAGALREEDVEVASVRAVDHSIPPGVESEMGEGDEWPGIRTQILDSEILISPRRPGSAVLRASPSGCWSVWTR